MRKTEDVELVFITTVDNPFSPLSQFDDWYNFDVGKKYNTCAYLARIANTSETMSTKEFNEEVERAVDQIIKYDPLPIYVKVRERVPVTTL